MTWPAAFAVVGVAVAWAASIVGAMWAVTRPQGGEGVPPPLETVMGYQSGPYPEAYEEWE